MVYQNAIKEAKEKGYKFSLKGDIITPKGKIRKLFLNSNGYYSFGFKTKENKVIGIEVHRFIGYMKYGDILFDKNFIIRHLNNNSKDNSFDNLGRGTHSENRYDMPEKERLKYSLNATSKVKIHNHEDILKRREQGATYKELMEEFNISSKGTLSFIINNSFLSREDQVIRQVS